MAGEIKESDWTIFKEVREIALRRYFDQATAELERLLADKSKESRERFWSVHESIEKSRDEMRRLFDDVRRSTALMQLAFIRVHGVVTDEEMGRFSAEAREYVQSVVDFSRR
jgi:hypothetical protein